MRKSKFLSVSVSTALVASMLLSGCGNTDSNASAGGNDAGNSESSAADSSAADSGENSGDNGGSGSGEGYVLTDLKVIVDGTVNSVKQETEPQRTIREAFIPQLEEAIGEKIGHEINIDFEVGNHTNYSEYVGRMFVSEQYPDVMIMSAAMASVSGHRTSVGHDGGL